MRSLVLFALAALSFTPSIAGAQIGGRIRSAVTGAARGQQQTPATQIVIVTITPEVVSSYEAALKARHQEMLRLARENSPTGQYFAGRLLRDSVERRRNEYRAQVGPDWEREQQLNAALQRGDTTAIAGLTLLQNAMHAEIAIPQTDWNTQHAANAHMDSVMMQTAGLNAGEWAYTNDVMLKLVGMTAYSGTTEDSVVARIAQSANVTPAEVRAVGARRIELSRAFAHPYRTDAQLARQLADNNEESSPADESAAGGANTKYAACLQTELKPMMDEAERRKTEFETAQKNGETAKLMEFTNRFVVAQQGATQKCAPLLTQ